jgi:hypothetical protein
MKAKVCMSSNELDMSIQEIEMLWNGCGVYVDTERFKIVRGTILFKSSLDYRRVLARVEKMKNPRFQQWFCDNSSVSLWMYY